LIQTRKIRDLEQQNDDQTEKIAKLNRDIRSLEVELERKISEDQEMINSQKELNEKLQTAFDSQQEINVN